MLTNDYSHTGAPTIPNLRHGFRENMGCDIIDAPDFLPCGYHFFATPGEFTCGGPMAAHAIRPWAFTSPKDLPAA